MFSSFANCNYVYTCMHSSSFFPVNAHFFWFFASWLFHSCFASLPSFSFPLFSFTAHTLSFNPNARRRFARARRFSTPRYFYEPLLLDNVTEHCPPIDGHCIAFCTPREMNGESNGEMIFEKRNPPVATTIVHDVSVCMRMAPAANVTWQRLVRNAVCKPPPKRTPSTPLFHTRLPSPSKIFLLVAVVHLSLSGDVLLVRKL